MHRNDENLSLLQLQTSFAASAVYAGEARGATASPSMVEEVSMKVVIVLQTVPSELDSAPVLRPTHHPHFAGYRECAY